MNRFPKAEKILLGIGIFLFLISGYLFLFETEWLSHLLGITSGSSRNVVAKVEMIKDNARRKTLDAPEFLPLAQNQPLFSKDTVMTGGTSGVVISFLNGDVVEVGPDTLIQIETKDSDDQNQDFVINVQKGNITGKSVSKHMVVKEKGAEKALKPLDDKGLSGYLVSAKPKPKIISCHLNSPKVSAPDATTQWKPKISIEVSCSNDATNADILVRNSKGEVLQNLSTDIGPDHQGKYDFAVSAADNYSIELKQDVPEKINVSVPGAYTLLNWAEQPLRCDYGVVWKPLLPPGKRLALFDDSGKLVKQAANPAVDHFSFLSSLMRLPKNVYLQLTMDSGFLARTPPLPLNRWRTCAVQKFPQDGARKDAIQKAPILFTWSLITHEDHYLFEVATDRDFNRVIFQNKTDQNLTRYPLKQKGVYFWRVQELNSRTQSDVYQIIVN